VTETRRHLLRHGLKVKQMSESVKAKSTGRNGDNRAQRQDAEQQASDLGLRLKKARLAKGFTLARLAERTDISIGTLSQIERGVVSPVVRTLYTVSTALGVSPAWLVDPDNTKDADPDARYVMRAGRGKLMLKAGGVLKTLVTPEAATELKAFLVELEPGSGSGDALYSHEGQEVGYVLLGSLDLMVEDRAYTLSEGDCFAFQSSLAHSFKNNGAVASTILWVNMRSQDP
jgi:transcriptional regulator with XRE-family HTH domain